MDFSLKHIRKPHRSTLIWLDYILLLLDFICLYETNRKSMPLYLHHLILTEQNDEDDADGDGVMMMNLKSFNLSWRVAMFLSLKINNK